MASELLQGLDTIPQQIARDFVRDFGIHLPGWQVNGAYNYQIGAQTQTNGSRSSPGCSGLRHR